MWMLSWWGLSKGLEGWKEGRRGGERREGKRPKRVHEWGSSERERGRRDDTMITTHLRLVGIYTKIDAIVGRGRVRVLCSAARSRP